MKCPQCNTLLLQEDMNPSTNVVLCRSCNKVSKFTDIDESRDEENLGPLPARIKVAKTMRGLEVRYRKTKLPGIVLLFFGLLWNSFISAVIFASLRDGKDTVSILFFSPFILIGLLVTLGTVYQLFGSMILTLNPGKGELFRGVGSIGRRQRFLLEENARITIEKSIPRNSNRILLTIVVEQPKGKPFKFGTDMHDGVQNYIVAILKKMRK